MVDSVGMNSILVEVGSGVGKGLLSLDKLAKALVTSQSTY